MPVMHSRDVLDINLPMSMKPDTAKQMAQKVLLSIWSERTTYDLMLPWTFLKYDPADIAEFDMNDGFQFTARLMKMDLGVDFSIQSSGVTQFPGSYTSEILASNPGGTIPIPTPPPPVTFPVILDVPFLADTDVIGAGGGFEYYWGAAGYTPGLKYAALEARLPPGDWSAQDATNYETVYGTILGEIPMPPNGPFATDDQTELILVPGHSFAFGDVAYEWETIPDAEWPNENNMLVVGDEVILYKTSEVMADETVKLTTLIRGWRGTEAAAYGHVGRFGEIAVVITDQGTRTGKEAIDLVNRNFLFRTISTGIPINLPNTLAKVLTAAPLKPYAPNDFKRLEDTPGAGDIRVTWQRRTRYGGGLKNLTDTVPLHEESEKYEAYILAAPYDPDTFDPSDPTTYIRAFLNLTTPQLDYVAASLTADGLTMDDTLYILAFQLSAQIGRGFPGTDILYHSVLA
jgi:hypothetical protein